MKIIIFILSILMITGCSTGSGGRFMRGFGQSLSQGSNSSPTCYGAQPMIAPGCHASCINHRWAEVCD